MLRIGELAKRTGLTVRTLRHYDTIGLLTPSHRNRAGYRFYSDEDAGRLQRIVALRQLGIPLRQIGSGLDGEEWTQREVLRLRAERLRASIQEQITLLAELDRLVERLDAAEGLSVDEILDTIGAMKTMEKTFEKYYTPEQREALAQRAETVGEERIQEVQNLWPPLIQEVKEAMAQGADPASPEVQALANRWKSLVEEFTGGDPGITQSLSTMHREEPSVGQSFGMDPALFAFIGKAQARAPGGEGS